MGHQPFFFYPRSASVSAMIIKFDYMWPQVCIDIYFYYYSNIVAMETNSRKDRLTLYVASVTIR